MVETIAPATPFVVGDCVELVTVPSHVRGVPAGSRGVILVDTLPFHSYSVSFDPIPDPDTRKPAKLFMIRGCHLRRVAD
jgi:hypothetical protein